MAEPQSISLDKENVSLPKLGATVSLDAKVQPTGADDRITWTSSDTKIAQVYDGVIVAGEVGTAEITAATSNGRRAEVFSSTRMTINIIGTAFVIRKRYHTRLIRHQARP